MPEMTMIIDTNPAAPARERRGLTAVGVGLLVALLAWQATQGGESDFQFWHEGARLLLSGVDPYQLRPGDARWTPPDPLFYPLPTLLIAAPLASLPLGVAAAVVLGLSSAGLSWMLSREGWHRLWFFATPGFVLAVEVGQWTPTLCLAALVPWLGALLVVKPNVGGPLFLWRPAWQAVAGGLVLLTVAFVIMPRWPLAWLKNLQLLESHPAPLFTWQGAWLWLALLRWRNADARFLLISAAAPQLLFFADQLPLALLARSRREVLATTACGLVSWLAWYASLHEGDLYVLRAAPFVLVGVYFPTLVMVLRRGTPTVGSADA